MITRDIFADLKLLSIWHWELLTFNSLTNVQMSVAELFFNIMHHIHVLKCSTLLQGGFVQLQNSWKLRKASQSILCLYCLAVMLPQRSWEHNCDFLTIPHCYNWHVEYQIQQGQHGQWKLKSHLFIACSFISYSYLKKARHAYIP